jgi:hypothetical protein
MADFTRQRQFKTREAVLPVDKGLPPGIHTFELVVTDESGNRSKAAQVKVEIVRLTVPVEPVTPVRPVVIDPLGPIINPVTPVAPVRPVTPVAPVTPTRPGRRPRPR